MLIALSTALAAPTAAHAETYTGVGDDAAADQATAGRDLVRVAATYDSEAGTLTATLSFREAPSAAANAFVAAIFAPAAADGTCDTGSGFTLLGTNLDPATTTAAWATSTSSTIHDATRTAGGTDVKITATDASLAGLDRRCVSVSVRTTTTPASDYDVLGTPVVLTAPAPPTPTTPTAAPNPPPPPTTPTTPTTQTAPPKPAPALTVTVRPLAAVSRGQWRSASVKVRNAGNRSAKKVSLKIGKLPRGVTLSPSKTRVSIGTLKASRSKTIHLRLKAGSKAAASSSIPFAASSTKDVATAKTTAILTLKSKRGGSTTPTTGSAPADPPGLSGQYFTKSTYTGVGPIEWDAYFFVSDRWVWRGVPEGGEPTCTAKTAGVDEKGNPTDGCLPYTYDPKSKQVTIDGARGTIGGDRDWTLTLGDDTFGLFPIPSAGTRYSVSLESIFSTGFYPNVVSTTSYLTLTMDGQFTRSSATFGVSGGGSSQPGGSDFTAIPADKKGTYEIKDHARLVLTYADGTVETRTIALGQSAKDPDPPDPARDNLLLDDSFYFLPS